MFIRNGKATGSILVNEPDEVVEVTEPMVEPEPVEVADEMVVEQQVETAEPPAQSDLKSAWVDFAVSQGHNREEAESLTKQELVDIFA